MKYMDNAVSYQQYFAAGFTMSLKIQEIHKIVITLVPDSLKRWHQVGLIPQLALPSNR
jgi:hypothetical protein